MASRFERLSEHFVSLCFSLLHFLFALLVLICDCTKSARPTSLDHFIMPTYSRIVLAERPKTFIEDKTFRKETAELPAESSLKPEDVLVKVEHLSLDPGEIPSYSW